MTLVAAGGDFDKRTIKNIDFDSVVKNTKVAKSIFLIALLLKVEFCSSEAAYALLIHRLFSDCGNGKNKKKKLERFGLRPL